MKVEKAIRLVEIAFGYSSSIHDGWKDDEADRGGWKPDDEAEKISPDDEAEKMAIEAMKKQIPMKPGLSPNGMFFLFECRECGTSVSNVNKYCHKCGQKLDWED